jgi:hypothetical protein
MKDKKDLGVPPEQIERVCEKEVKGLSRISAFVSL